MATQPETTAAEAGRNVVPMSPQREGYAIMKDKAKMFALSPLIPEHLRAGGADQAAANCLIALQMAEAMGESPLVVMQNIHIVKGKAGFAAQYMIARANASGVFKGRIGWRVEGKGDDLSVTAYATLADTGEEVSFTCDMAMARAEGWVSNPKYKSMPEVMLRYRSATFLVRFYAPDVMLGYQTAEETEDVLAAAGERPAPLTGQALLDQAREDPEPEAVTVEAETIEHQPEGPDQSQLGESHNTEDDHPAVAKAQEIVSKLKRALKQERIDDIRRDHAADLEALPDDVRPGVDEAFEVAERRVAEAG